MIERFISGGVMMWPLLAVALGIAALTVRAVLQLRQGETGLVGARAASRSILFWGVMSLLLGALGTVVGLVLMGDAIHRAGGAGSGLIWGGVGVSLVSLVFGLLILLFSGLAWLGVRWWGDRLATRTDI